MSRHRGKCGTAQGWPHLQRRYYGTAIAQNDASKASVFHGTRGIVRFLIYELHLDTVQPQVASPMSQPFPRTPRRGELDVQSWFSLSSLGYPFSLFSLSFSNRCYSCLSRSSGSLPFANKGNETPSLRGLSAILLAFRYTVVSLSIPL